MLKRKDKGLAVPVVVTILMLVAVAVGVLTYNVAFDVSDTTMGGVDQAYETLTKDNLEYPKPGDIPGAYPGGNLGGNTGTGGGSGESEGTTPEETFVISFNANGHTFDDGTYINQVTYVIEDEQVKLNLGTLKLPVSDTHEFTGWYLDAICSKPVTIPGEIREDTTVYAGMKAKPPVIYAVYSETDNSLRFYNRPKVPAKGETYEGVVTSEVYTGFDDKSYTSTAGAPWYAQADKIKTIEFKDEVAFADGAYLFNGLSLVESVDLQGMDIDQARSTEGMFKNLGSAASSKVVIKNLGSLNTSKVTNMREMFSGVAYMADGVVIDLNGLETQNVTDMSSMFYLTGCYAEEVLLNNLNKMNVSKVQAMDHMFEFVGYSATGTKLNLSTWQPDALVTANSMFANVGAYSDDVILIGPETWTMTNLQDATRMFRGLAYSDKEFALDLTNWEPIALLSIEEMFDCMGYSSEKWAIGDISSWNMEAVTNANRAFAYAGAATSAGYKLNLTNWNLAQANPVDIFKGTNYLKEITVGAQWVWSENGLLEKPSEAYFANADGHWYDIDNKARFAPENLPDNVAATYHVAVPGYTIAFNANGGKFADGNINNVTYKIALVHAGEYKEPVRPGYAFAGWYLNAAGTGEQLILEDFIAALSQDVTVYAKWVELSVELLPGPDFNSITPSGVASVVFTYDVAPEGVETIDLSSAGDKGVIGWLNGTTYYVSTQRDGVKVRANVNLSNMFYHQKEISNVDFSALDTSYTQNMSRMFYYTGHNKTDSFTVNANLLNTSNVTNMEGMFYHAGEMAKVWSVGNLDNWDVSKVTNMNSLFYSAAAVAEEWNIGTLENWDTSNVEGMHRTFWAANKAKTVKLDLSKWNMSKVKDTSYMFHTLGEATQEFSIGDLSTKTVTKADGTKYTAWDMKNVKNVDYMFYCSGKKAETYDIGNIGNWELSGLKSLNRMFAYTGQVATVYNIGDLSTKEVTREDGTKYIAWNTSGVTNMDRVFAGAGDAVPDFNIGDIGTWDVSQVTTMDHMLFGTGQTSNTYYIGDLTNWDVSKVQNMNGLFNSVAKRAKVITIGDIFSTWDVSNVTDMGGMFKGCFKRSEYIKTVDLSNWDMAKVTNTSRMFLADDAIEEIILPASLKTIGEGFAAECYALKTIKFLHSPTDIAEIAPAGNIDGEDETTFEDGILGPFYISTVNRITDVTAQNPVFQTYDWEADNRNVNKEYTISFDANGGTFSSSSINKVTYTKRFDSILNIEGQIIEPIWAGYQFNGWYTSKSYSTKFDETNINSDMTVYAKWQEKTNGMTSGSTFNSLLPSEATTVVFTYAVAPSGVETTDLSAAGDKGVVGWLDGTTYYVSTQRSGVDVLAAKDSSYMFDSKSSIKTIDATALNTSNVESMENMFNGCAALATLDVSGFETGKVTTMKHMFDGCSSLKTLDVSNFDTKNVDTMSYMFKNCSAVTEIDVSNFVTNKVTAMHEMFYGCSSVQTLDVADFDTSKVTALRSMFNGCTNLKEIDVTNWDTSQVTQMGGTFKGCESLEKIGDLNTKTVTKPDGTKYTAWDVSKVFDITETFYNCRKLTSIGTLSKWNTKSLKYVQSTFNECRSLVELDLSDWDMAKVVTLNWVFSNSESLESVGDLSDWNTSSVTSNMNGLFMGCDNLKNIGDISGWDVSEVTAFTHMFNGCKSLEELNLTGWQTGKVKNMQQMFFNCYNLRTIGDVSDWDTSSLSGSLIQMFQDCYKLEQLDLSNWKLDAVNDTSLMFMSCGSLRSVGDLSKWNTAAITNMYGMFYGCSSLTELNLANWDTMSVTNMRGIFSETLRLGKITLGDKFSFTGDGTTETSLTAPLEQYIPGADNLHWWNAETGVGYTYGTIPSNTAATYVAAPKYEVKYNANGGVGVMANSSHLHNTEKELTANVFTREGYTFAGWATSENGDVVYADKAKVKDLTTIDGAVIQLYAKWKEIKAFAVYSETDNSLTFYNNDNYEDVKAAYDNTANTNETYDKYNHKVVTALYTGFDTETYTDSSMCPWKDVRENVKKVSVEQVIKPKSLEKWFYGMINLEEVDVAKIDTPDVESLKQMFWGCIALKEIDITGWNTSKVTSLYGTFGSNSTTFGTMSLERVVGIENIDTSNVESMYVMFQCCLELKELDLSRWDTSSVTDMSYAFGNCFGLESLNVSTWDTSNVTTFKYTFGACKSLKELDVSRWDTSSSTSFRSMFSNCESLSSLNLESKEYTKPNGEKYLAWDVSKGEQFISMFENCLVAQEINMTNWNTASANNFNCMFNQCEMVKKLDVSSFSTSKVISFGQMFEYCYELEEIIGLENFDTTGITLHTFNEMFSHCRKLKVIDVSNFDTTNADEMDRMFNDCASVEFLDLSGFNTHKATDMHDMFTGTTSLKKVTFGENFTRSGDGSIIYNSVMAFLMAPSNDNIPGADGKWYNTAGKAFVPADIPNDTADTYYAIPEYQVKYDANGGQGVMVNTYHVHNDNKALSPNTFTYPGYAFSGWSTKADGSGTTYADNSTAVNLSNKNGATVTLYAMWTPRSEILVAGPTFMNNIPANATEVLFTYDIAPAGATLYDLSEAKDSGVVGWMSGTKFYVSTQRPGVKVKTGTNASNMFYNKSNIINIDLTALDSSAATTMSRMFYYAGGNSTTSFTVNANLLNTSNVTNMEGMFYRCGYQAKDWSIGNLDGFDTSKVTNMANIFYCAGVNATNWDIGTLSTWKTGKVTTFYRAFHSAAQHTPNAIAIDLSNWDTSNVTTMQQMFMYFGYKTPHMEIGDIGNWNTSKVTNFADFMRYATATSSVADFGDLGTKIVTRADGSTYVAWDVANATTMENMFYYVGLNAERFDIGNIGNWNVSKVTNMKGMFEQAGTAATYWYIGDLSTKTITYIHDAPYTAWNVKNVTDMSRMFMSCAHSMPIVSIGNIGTWNVSKVTTFNNFMRSFGYLSESCYIGDLSNWNVSGANDMESMFHSCATFATDIDIGDILKTWDISNVTNTKLMFKGSMTQSPFFNDADFSQWDFSNVTDNSKMFYMNTGIHNLTLPASLRKIDEGFIAEDHELQSITFLHDKDDTVTFAQPGAIYGEKDGAYDDDTFGPFYHPSDGALIKLTVNTVNPHIQNYDWETDHRDVSQRFYITYHGNGGTFNGATKNEVRYSNRFDVITVFNGTEMTPTKPGYAFAGWYTDANCTAEFDISGRVLSASAYAKWEPLSLKLVSGADLNAAIPNSATSVVFTTEEAPVNAELNDLSANKDAGVVGWLAGNTYYVSTQRSGANPQAPANASTMFKNKTSLTTIDVRALETEQTTNMEEMFRGCTSLTTIAGLAEFNTSKVTTMKNMFRGNTNLLNGSLAGISGWDMSKVTTIYSMFRECTQLTMLNTGNWKTDSLTNSEYLFYDCTNLEAVDVSKWNMSKVTTAKYMFYGTTNLTNLGTNNVRNWDVRKLKDASWMFGVSGLNELDVSLWNTQSLVDASAIFNTLNNITELDVSNWNTSNVTTFHGMFANSDNLETLGADGVKNWNTEKVTNTYAMFNACSSLTEIDVSNWDTSSLETAYKMFWHCISLQSVDISNWDMSKVTNTTKMFSNCKSLKELVLPASLKVIGMGFGNELYDIKIVFKHAPSDELTFVREPGLHSTATDSYSIDCGAFYSLAKQEITLDTVHPTVLNYDWETDNKVVKFDSDEIITFAIMENGVANEYVAYAGSNFGEWLDGSLDSNDYYADSSNGVIADGFTLYSFEDYFLTPIETSTEIVEGRIYHRGRNAAGRLTIYDPLGVKRGTWQFEPGMTFREMADSEYNIGGMIYIHPDNASDSVYTEWSRTQPISVEGFVRPSDVIPDNAEAQISPEHGGGTND